MGKIPSRKENRRAEFDTCAADFCEFLYESRTLQAKDGVFVDDLAGYVRHIYRIVK